MDQSFEKHPKLMRFYGWAIPALAGFNLIAINVVGGLMARWSPQAVRMAITMMFAGVLIPMLTWWKMMHRDQTLKQMPIYAAVAALVFLAGGGWTCVQAAYGINRPDHIRVVQQHRSAHPAHPVQ